MSLLQVGKIPVGLDILLPATSSPWAAGVDFISFGSQAYRVAGNTYLRHDFFAKIQKILMRFRILSFFFANINSMAFSLNPLSIPAQTLSFFLLSPPPLTSIKHFIPRGAKRVMNCLLGWTCGRLGESSGGKE